jgi:hypothetical protein
LDCSASAASSACNSGSQVIDFRRCDTSCAWRWWCLFGDTKPPPCLSVSGSVFLPRTEEQTRSQGETSCTRPIHQTDTEFSIRCRLKLTLNSLRCRPLI